MDTFQHSCFHFCSYGPDIISATSCKCVIHLEAAQPEFWHTGNMSRQANWSHNMSCFNSDPMLVSTSRKHRILKHVTKDLKFETYHLLKHVKFRWVGWHKFQCPGSPRLKTYCPSKHVKFWELCFSAMCTCSMFPMQNPSIML